MRGHIPRRRSGCAAITRGRLAQMKHRKEPSKSDALRTDPKIASPLCRGGSTGSEGREENVYLGELRHELDIGDDILQCSPASRGNCAIGFICYPVEGFLEPGILLESAGIVWIGL